MNDIDRLLWRYETRIASASVIGARLNEEINALVARYRAEEQRWARIAQSGQPAFALREQFDRQLNSARIAMYDARMQDCWHHLRNAQDQLLQLAEAARANDAMESVATVVAILSTDEAIPTEFAHLSSTVLSARRLLDCARDEYANRRYDAARYMAELTRRLIGQSTLFDDNANAHTHLSQRVAELRKLDARLQEQMPQLPATLTLASALQIVDGFMKRNLAGLAERLVCDIEEIAAARAAFFRELNREHQVHELPAGASAGTCTTLQQIPAELLSQGAVTSEVWRSFTTQLLQRDLHRVASYVQSIRAALPAADAPLGDAAS